MPEHSSDFVERGPVPKHFSAQGVSEHVGTSPGRCYTRSLDRLPNHNRPGPDATNGVYGA